MNQVNNTKCARWSDISEMKKRQGQCFLISEISEYRCFLLDFLEKNFPELINITLTELTSESFKKEILNLSLRDILKKKLEQDCFGNILS